MTNESIVNQDMNNFMPSYARYPIALVSGKGVHVTDANGKGYLDMGSGIGVNSLGYCDEGWVKAVANQAATLQHVSNYYHQPVQSELAELLCKAAGMSKVFFGNSGAEANECAIKLARKYSFDTFGGERNEIITLRNSFHGRTLTTLSATGQDAMHNYFFPFTEGFEYVEAGNIDALKSKINDKTCAVFMELIQGEGGVLPLPQEYVKQTEQLCREHELLLIIDEVQSGVGRTGTFYCYQQYDIQPDIITSAKGLGGGLPIGACLCNEKLSGVLSAGMHGSTFGGNPVVCAGAVEVVKRLSGDGFLNEVTEKGLYISDKLKELPNVEKVQGRGLMLGFSLMSGTAKEVAARCLENGLLVLTAKANVRLLPPLTITYEEIDEGLGILKNVLENLEGEAEEN